MPLQLAVGDRLIWRRNDGDHRCEVLEVSKDGKRAKIKIEGWVGTNWETIGHEFRREGTEYA